MPCLTRSFFAALLVMPVVFAQEGPPSPAPELQKLAPLIGNWAGTGSATFGPGAPPTAWHARGTYRWCLDKHFVQEDFEITFEGLAAPLVFRAYFGWDRENQRYVNAAISNEGKAQLVEMKFLPDGTMVQVSLQSQEGMPYAERWRLKVEGDKLMHSIDLLMPEGPSMSIVDGHFKRVDAEYAGAFDTKVFEGAVADESIKKLTRSAGVYATQGTMVMAPGQPSMKISGTDTFRSVFGGTVFHGHTVGTAEGMPGEYHGEVFWAHDPMRRCIVGIYVSNMGEVMSMDAWFTADGKLISTSAGLMQGQPTVQSMVMEFDAKGVPTSAVGHAIIGTAAPFENFRANYTKK
ncbi:MAG: DUF1579 family protein [Planctomycetota bacterium]